MPRSRMVGQDQAPNTRSVRWIAVGNCRSMRERIGGPERAYLTPITMPAFLLSGANAGLGRDHPGPPAAEIRARAGTVRRGGGNCCRAADSWGVPGGPAADGHRRVRVDAPDTPENAAAFGFAGPGADDAARPAYPKVRVVTVSECASHAVADAAMGGVAGKGAGEQSLARKLYRRLEEGWLLIADRNFYNWADWCTATDSGAQLLWRVKADLTLPVLDLLPDGSYSSVLVNPKARGKARQQLIDAARAGKDLGEDQARYVRVIEYEVLM